MTLVAKFIRNEDILSVMSEWSFDKKAYTYTAEYYGYNSGRYFLIQDIETYVGALRTLVKVN